MKYTSANAKGLLGPSQGMPFNLKKMLETEQHHNHEIIMDNGPIRWKEDKAVIRLADSVGFNRMIESLHANGYNKNSEEYRKLYRNIGYSLSGYWGIFYWSVNNSICNEYEPPSG